MFFWFPKDNQTNFNSFVWSLNQTSLIWSPPSLPTHSQKLNKGELMMGCFWFRFLSKKNLPLLFFYSLWKRFEGKSKDFKPTLHPCVAISVSQLFSSFQSTAVTATAGDELRLNNQRRTDVTSTKVKTYFPPFIMEYFNFVVQKIKTFRT